jgi:uncharacterized surface protein with fasciclin (FAS1) repeats
VVPDTLSTADFLDGRMKTPTAYQQYLTTGAGFDSKGNAVVMINGYAGIIKGNIRLTNGIIHIIDHVLDPITITLAQLIESKPEYSIFTQALKYTGLYDTLNVNDTAILVKNRSLYTVLAETDANYKEYNINSFDELKNQIMQLSPANPAKPDSLYLYMAYHILVSNDKDPNSGMKYFTDLEENNASMSFIQLPISSRMVSDTIMMINETIKDGAFIFGTQLVRKYSNLTAANGVLHTLAKSLEPRMPLVPRTLQPHSVFWEVTDQPEIKANPNYQKASFTFGQSGIKTMTWVSGSAAGNVMYYEKQAINLADYAYCNSDNLNWDPKDINVPKVTFKTPYLIHGKYKVWVCGGWFRNTGYEMKGNFYYKPWLQADNDNDVDVAADSLYVKLPNFYNNYFSTTWGVSNAAPNTNMDANQLEALNLKVYTITNDSTVDRGKQTNSYGFTTWGFMLGTMDVQVDGYIRLKFLAVGGDKNLQARIDMFHFIPVLESQVWPKFTRTGRAIGKFTTYALTTKNYQKD